MFSSEKLPAHVKRMSHGGLACMHCGGAVDPDGYAEGGYAEDDDMDEDDAPQAEELDGLFAKALRR